MEDETLVTDDRLADQAELSPWLALLHAPGIGPITLARLLEHYQTPGAILAAGQSEKLRASGLLKKNSYEYLSNPDWGAVESDLNWARSDPTHHILTLDSRDYPVLLRQIADPPPVLFVKGDVSLLNYPQLAIVGSRNPSPVGAETSYAFARSLSACGLTITSGLALGVDAAAHRGALDGNGATIAVTGTGLDRVYPAQHRKLAHAISARGALVSEFPPGTAPKPDHFPRRNRIISGLSLGTLVTEAALRSGSLITAQQALEQGREVFAIPGSIHNPLARGCHSLLRNGAKLVEEICDIIDELGQFQPAVSTRAPNQRSISPAIPGLDQQQQMVVNNLGFEPTSMDTLIERTGFSADNLATSLLSLELAGLVSAVPGGLYMRRPKNNGLG
jgi:DNA processing protein